MGSDEPMRKKQKYSSNSIISSSNSIISSSNSIISSSNSTISEETNVFQNGKSETSELFPISDVDPIKGDMIFKEFGKKLHLSINFKNRSNSMDLTGCYLYSKTADVVFNFPSGEVLNRDQNIVIAVGKDHCEAKEADYNWNDLIFFLEGDEIILYNKKKQIIWSQEYWGISKRSNSSN